MGDEAPEDGASHHALKMGTPVQEVKDVTLKRVQGVQHEAH
jgi:hypothetical protein